MGSGRADGRTDVRTDGHTLLNRCENASIKKVFFSQFLFLSFSSFNAVGRAADATQWNLNKRPGDENSEIRTAGNGGNDQYRKSANEAALSQ